MPLSEDPDPLIRLTDARYADADGTVVETGDPVAISAQLFDQDGAMPNSGGLSNLFVAWGQFLDHDLSLSLEGETEILTADGLVAPLHRSEYVLDDSNSRLPLNAISWQIDGSQIYGTTDERTDALRAHEGGKLRMQDDLWSDTGLMPDADTGEMAGAGDPAAPVFLAGDVRANENPALASMHTLWTREHNYWAERLAEEHPDWTDDQLFDGARQIVTYELQQITYDEWLPHLIGDAAGDHTGHDPDVSGQISVEFSTAAFRFGHTMVSSTLERLNEDGSVADGGNLQIMEAFFNAATLRDGGIDAILRGQAASFAQELDTQVVDDLNFFLSTPGGMTGFSLVALNVLRGQDHGLQSYLDTRAALIGDIDPAQIDGDDFSVITPDPDLQAALAEVYLTVHDVDLWVGGLAEPALEGTQMGPLFTHIIADQFIRTRAADPDFGQLDPDLGANILAEVQNTTFADIILRNTEIDHIQDDPFLAAPRTLDPTEAPEATGDDDVHALVACDVTGELATGRGDDDVTLTGGTRLNEGANLGQGNDTLTMSSGTAVGGIRGGEGDDVITLRGSASADWIGTGNGKDDVTIDESASVTGLLSTGNGKDVVTIGGRASVGTIDTGNGPDQINLAHGADIGLIDGGNGPDAITVTEGRFRVDWTDGDPRTGSGEIVYLDGNGDPVGDPVPFRNIESVTCFTPGTRIITATGTCPVEDIAVGDRVWTLDAGLKTVRWVGRVTIPAVGRQAPVRIPAGYLGNSRTLEVSPQHRMLISDWRCELVCGQADVLAPAIHLVDGRRIRRRIGGLVTYIHLLFDDHQIVMADGIPSESFHPGRVGLGAMSEEARAEILALFPELAADADTFGPAARYSAKPHEIAVIRRIAASAQSSCSPARPQL